MNDETLPPFKKHPRLQKVREWFESHPVITSHFGAFLLGFVLGAALL